MTVYSHGAAAWLAPPQPGDEVLRSQETRRTAGLPRARTIMLDPLPLTQSAELQMRRAEAMTTDTNFVPILKRHGCAPWETACTNSVPIRRMIGRQSARPDTHRTHDRA